MSQRRYNKRVDLHYPIFCIFTNNDLNLEIKSNGYVHDLSLGGMRICVPLPPQLYNSKTLEYQLILPEPFQSMNGNGKVKWTQKLEDGNCMIFGMEFIRLDSNYKKDLTCIIDELNGISTEDCPPSSAD